VISRSRQSQSAVSVDSPQSQAAVVSQGRQSGLWEEPTDCWRDSWLPTRLPTETKDYRLMTEDCDW